MKTPRIAWVLCDRNILHDVARTHLRPATVEPGDAVYEPFSGSGTTIIAGEMTGRRVLAIKMNPIYVDFAVRRWQNFTDKKATRKGDDALFDDLTESVNG